VGEYAAEQISPRQPTGGSARRGGGRRA
jgi:hypothetical protein